MKRFLVLLAVLLPSAAIALDLTKTWADEETLTHTDLNANFTDVKDWADLIDPDEDGKADKVSSTDGARVKWARDFLSGSTTCGIEEAIDDLPSSNRGGVIVLPAQEECTNVSTQVVITGRSGLVLEGWGMANANLTSASTRLVWTGADDTAMFLIRGCRGCSFADFSIYGDNTPGFIAVHYESDNANARTTNKNEWRNVSIRNGGVGSFGFLVLGVDQSQYNDQTDTSSFINVEIREFDTCYEFNGKQIVGMSIFGGECTNRLAGAGINLIRGWVNLYNHTMSTAGTAYGECSTATDTVCAVDGDCPGVETCVLQTPGPAFYKGTNAGALNIHGLYTELGGPGLVCESDSANARPIVISGGRFNMRADPDTGDPDDNHALIDCDQVGPIVIDGVTFEAPDTNELADIKLYDTPVKIQGVTMIGASNAVDETKFKWVHGDPRGQRYCETLYAPNDEITDANDIPSIWVADWRSKILEIWCESDQTVVMNLQRDDGTPANIATSNLTCTSTPSSTRTLSATESVLAKDHRLDLAIASVSGDPKRLAVCWQVDRQP